ncbi:MAG: tRNA (adenosine(37)-N6)-dimethylallyltransferase MiaA [Verrucomicrobia bacterium]|nr:tRNA (adenosine(37)-N6)-dimethylallyltransferase MiaA [Verrucomicrobiota bacterium]
MGSASSQLQPLFFVGPTAVGKSEVALLLAERLRGEIITVDSMQAYRGLDIGTAKPTAAEQARIPHHLLDVAELHEPFDAGKFVALARAAVAGIQSRGRLPIFCGGTGLYVKAFVDGLGQAPPSDPVIRAELEATPLDTMLSELSKHDPVTYERIDRQNPRRVIRALEVIRITGQPFSAQRAEWKSTDAPAVARDGKRIIGLARSAGDLRARIDARVEQMFRQGLVAETSSLLAGGLEKNPTAMQAIGYRQVVEHLRGERSLEETIELVKIRTRQFAKRQMTWFRRQLSVQWLEVRPGESASEITTRVEALIGPEGP